MLTIDASVWVNADSPTEQDSASSRLFLDRVAAASTPVYVPTLLRIEIAAAISRTRKDPVLAKDYSDKLAALPFVRWVPLDDALAERGAILAADLGLRGADAVYAAVALTHNCRLISLDREHLTRLPSAIDVRTPSQEFASRP